MSKKNKKRHLREYIRRLESKLEDVTLDRDRWKNMAESLEADFNDIMEANKGT